MRTLQVNGCAVGAEVVVQAGRQDLGYRLLGHDDIIRGATFQVAELLAQVSRVFQVVCVYTTVVYAILLRVARKESEMLHQNNIKYV